MSSGMYSDVVYTVVCVYLIRMGLGLAIGELLLHEGVVEECRHVVVLSGKKIKNITMLSNLGRKQTVCTFSCF